MNKYERALKKVVKETNGTAIEMLLLLELVERATPKKVHYEYYEPHIGGVAECPNCKLELDHEEEFAHCNDCGQALDWSE
jgi:predicted Zn-ribbon and HTH transcriptional regulator